MSRRCQSRRLNRKISIQEQLTSKGHLGQPVGSWVDIHSNIWAEVRDQKANEAVDSNQNRLSAISYKTFVIRFRKGITPLHRIIYEGQEYQITGVTDLENRKWLKLPAYSVFKKG